MKKILILLVVLAFFVGMFVVPSFASDEEAPTVTDITADVKCVTVYDMYLQKLPVVRADAVFIPSTDYDESLIAQAPGAAVREITFTDWETSGMENYFDDDFNYGDGCFMYDAVWANSNTVDYDHGRLSYLFKVPEAGTYEIVFVGAAQIKEADVDNDAKDRGFAFSINEGDIRQVNISDTLGTFRKYDLEYGKADLDSTKITTANGENSTYFQVAYYYGITVELEAGVHSLDYYHLFSSGEHEFVSGNGPRLNYMGAYVQKYLSDEELENYEYPVITPTPEATPVVTPEPEAATPTAPLQEATTAPTAAPKEEEGGCGSAVGLGMMYALIPVAFVIRKKRG